jgi:NADP-dependent 3-hydroxy acid dehydrogenase YdfG
MEPLQDGNPDDWDRMIDTNVKGLLYLSHAIIPLMKNVEGAQIVNVGSVAGKEVYPSGNVYSGSKHAVDAITRSMRIDLLPLGIRVSTVSPGLVETEFSVVRFHGDDERAKKVYQGIDPLTGADIAELVRYIIEAPFRITIADIVVMPDRQGSSRDVRRGS